METGDKGPLTLTAVGRSSTRVLQFEECKHFYLIRQNRCISITVAYFTQVATDVCYLCVICDVNTAMPLGILFNPLSGIVVG